MKLYDLLKTMFDDFMRERWGDLIAILLVVFGAHFVVLYHDEAAKDLGKLLVGSGLAMLKVTKMPSKTNGNGSTAT